MRGWVAYLMAWMVALCAGVPAVASPVGQDGPSSMVSTAEAPTLRRCQTEVGARETLAELVSPGRAWDCTGGTPSSNSARVALRFALGPRSDARFVGTRPTLFERVSVALLANGGIVASQSFLAEEIIAAHDGRLALVSLPKVAGGERADELLVVFDHPSTRALAADAKVYSRDPTLDHGAMKRLLLAAIVCGMLAMPLAFNAAHYRVLKDRFVVWHIVVSAGLLTQCLLTSGILSHFVDLPIPLFARLTKASFGISVAAAAAFCAALIEKDRLHPRLRFGLYIAGAQVLLSSFIEIAFTGWFGPNQTIWYYVSFVPATILFIAVMIDAARRKSRAVRYQVIGWTPFIVVGVVRIVTMAMPTTKPLEAMDLFYFAMVIESVVTFLGVADRFAVIRRERDVALSRANVLERLSEHDDLTGLYNRRALDGVLGDFAAQKFSGFALFDLDHFKRVNDTHGHAVGDAVLRTVAQVLASHENAVALRLGGEEFLLLLRGEGVSERVERLRESIPVRIAREVHELEMLVTSSAGLIEADGGTLGGHAFAELYHEADGLLYEAKHNGRNLLAAVKKAPWVAPAPGATTVAA